MLALQLCVSLYLFLLNASLHKTLIAAAGSCSLKSAYWFRPAWLPGGPLPWWAHGVLDQRVYKPPSKMRVCTHSHLPWNQSKMSVNYCCFNLGTTYAQYTITNMAALSCSLISSSLYWSTSVVIREASSFLALWGSFIYFKNVFVYLALKVATFVELIPGAGYKSFQSSSVKNCMSFVIPGSSLKRTGSNKDICVTSIRTFPHRFFSEIASDRPLPSTLRENRFDNSSQLMSFVIFHSSLIASLRKLFPGKRCCMYKSSVKLIRLLAEGLTGVGTAALAQSRSSLLGSTPNPMRTSFRNWSQESPAVLL